MQCYHNQDRCLKIQVHPNGIEIHRVVQRLAGAEHQYSALLHGVQVDEILLCVVIETLSSFYCGDGAAGSRTTDNGRARNSGQQCIIEVFVVWSATGH